MNTQRHGRWRAVAGAVVVAAALAAGAMGTGRVRGDEPASAGGPGGSGGPGSGATQTCFAPRIRMVVDFGDGTQVHYTRVDLAEAIAQDGMYLVLDAMNGAAKQTGATETTKANPRAFVFEHKGSGERVFVQSIGGVKNEGAGAGKRNWQYWINDERGKASVGVARVRPGDRVTWAFATFEGEATKRPD